MCVFCLPSSCTTCKQTGQSLALTLCAVSVTQKDTSQLFCMHLKASQVSWLVDPHHTVDPFQLGTDSCFHSLS